MSSKKRTWVPSYKKEILRTDVERAMNNSLSIKAAARYLGVDVKTYKKYASMYKAEDGRTLYECHNNKAAAGISKNILKTPGGTQLIDIMEGKIDKTFVSLKVFKSRILAEGLFKEECTRCGYHEKRTLDEKVPLIRHFIDGNKRNWKHINVEFLCYNCYFLCIGDVFNKRQLAVLEDYREIQTKKIDFDLPEAHEEAIKKLTNLENKYIYRGDEGENITFDDIDTKSDDYGSDLIASFNRK